MKYALAGLFCALIFSSLGNGQERPDTTRPAGQRRGGAAPRFEPPAAGRQITLDVLIADLAETMENPTAAKLLELEKSGKLAAATRLRMATLDELPGFIQFGGRIASRTAPGGGRGSFGGTPPGSSAVVSVPSAPQNTSVQLQATTRMEEDGSIVMQIYLERPEAAVPQKVTAADASDEARRNYAFLSQSTVRLKSGEATLISGRTSGWGSTGSCGWPTSSPARLTGRRGGTTPRPPP